MRYLAGLALLPLLAMPGCIYMCDDAQYGARALNPDLWQAIGGPDQLPLPGGETSWHDKQGRFHEYHRIAADEGLAPPTGTEAPWSETTIVRMFWTSPQDDGIGLPEGVQYAGGIATSHPSDWPRSEIEQDARDFLTVATNLAPQERETVMQAMVDVTDRRYAVDADFLMVDSEGRQMHVLAVGPERLVIWNWLLATTYREPSERDFLAVYEEGPWRFGLWGSSHHVEFDHGGVSLEVISYASGLAWYQVEGPTKASQAELLSGLDRGMRSLGVGIGTPIPRFEVYSRGECGIRVD